MTTSEFEQLTTNLASGGGWADALNAAQAGLPDPAILTRMANEFFKADFAAASSIATQDASSAAGFTGAPELAAAAGLTEEALRALPATLAGAAPPDVALPGLPGGLRTGDLTAIPSFGFLEEARSLLASVPAAPIHAVPAPAPIKIPTDTVPREVAAVLPGAPTPRIPASAAELAAPQIPGSVVHTPDPRRASAYDFLDVSRPLEPFITLGGAASAPLQPAAADPFPEIAGLPFDVNSIRRDFPILSEQVNGRPLVWLDNAATTQKPQAVLDRLAYFYAHENSNIHRAAHTLAARATDAYEAAREKVARFLNASSASEIVFVRGATEGINLVAQSWGRRNIQQDDEIVITWLEHHANIVPWQMLCAEKGARLRVAPVDDHGQILLDEYEKLLGPRTRLVSLAHVSNALGTVTPVAAMVESAHRHGARVLVDGAQAVSHLSVDVEAYDCDFYVFSGHKVFAPTGIGVVYGKQEVLGATPPWQGGGNMIADVTFEKTVYQAPPSRFEAGTGNIADAVGLGAALDYLGRIGMPNVTRYEHDLVLYATEALARIPGLRLIGTAPEKASVLSFVLDGFRTEEVGNALSKEGIAVRAGHHCAQPILRRFGVESTVRPSLAFYNTCEEIDALAAALWNLKQGRNPGLI